MPHTTRTMGLGGDWDLTLTGTGKMALHDSAMATAQNVTNEIRRFVRDTYFAYDVGVPHFEIELGHPLPEAKFRAALRAAALRVDDVSEVAGLRIDDFDQTTRSLVGEIQVRTVSGLEFTVTF
ncbi:MAG: hypothetical protein LIP77_05770 [Planctomycetes bacterium]|nr:hypothetical protein [Planctomycetota bacterium]